LKLVTLITCGAGKYDGAAVLTVGLSPVEAVVAEAIDEWLRWRLRLIVRTSVERLPEVRLEIFTFGVHRDQGVARIATAVAGVAPRIMGFGPAPAMRKVLAKAGLKLADIDVIELNEAFAAQALAVLRDHGIADEAAHVNPNGGAIALGHPLGASGARLMTTLVHELERTGSRYGLQTMCEGGGMANATIIERLN
jgi:acetyl-CoA acetyltransferase